ncbi:hypothetical protein LCGC14_2109020 [marine sediment metagenome]|uniref:Uncharacterized protein n=1 Tax=marine sediment metagenome TaxID=412755 RepID=A0A0F9E7R0_9ZZZZ
MEKLTFKQYLSSKEKLREAIKQTPVHKAEHMMRKYCKLPVGESKDKKEYISLKPKQKLIVEWHYEDLYNPSLVSFTFEGIDDVDSEKKHFSFWSDERFKNWLFRNTREL